MATKKRLLVEGANDMHVILALQGHRGVRFLDKDDIIDCKDEGRLLSSLPVRLQESDISVLGVVMDADVNLPGRWTQLSNVLLAAGYLDVPNSPASSGTIVEAPQGLGLPRFGAWLMPDNSNSGILEDFLRFLVPTNCTLIGYAEQSLSNLPDRRFSQVAETKALIHTWLAWQEEPGRPLGQSITARYLDGNVPQAAVFMNWLNRLFSETVL